MTFYNRNSGPRPVPLRTGPVARPPEQPVRPIGPSIDDGTGDYPILVIRLMHGVYQGEKVRVRRGPPSVSLKVSKSLLQHPKAFKANGQISQEARDLLVKAVLAAVRQTGFRICIVWGPAWCSFVEPDGSIKRSFEPPSGGFRLRSPVDLSRCTETSVPGVQPLEKPSKGSGQ